MESEKRGPPGFWEALVALPENPIAAREWRSLRKSLRDARLWMGLRIPRDAREWGVPVIAWTAPVPYFVWGLMLLTKRLAPQFVADIPRLGLDVTALCFGVYCGYTAFMSAIIMSSAISRERERETWDMLRSATLGRHEMHLGLLAGLLGPMLIAQTVVGVIWLLARPHYMPLLLSLAPVLVSPMQIVDIIAITLFLSLALGAVALAFSSMCRKTGVAVVLSVIAAALLPYGTLLLFQLFSERLPTAWEGVGVCCVVAAGAYALAYHGINTE